MAMPLPAPKSLLRRVRRPGGGNSGLLRAARKVAAALYQHMFIAGGLVVIDWGCFHLGDTVGGIVTGLSLLVFNEVIGD